MDIEHELLAVVDALNHERIPYALCGGVCLAFHGCVRATQDIDLLVRQIDLPRLRVALRSTGFMVWTPKPMEFRRAGGGVTRVHRVCKFVGEDFMILDLIEIGAGHEAAWKSRTRRKLQGRSVSLISARELARMKKVAGRLWSLTTRERGMAEGDLNRRLRKLSELNRFCQALRKAGQAGRPGVVREQRAAYNRPTSGCKEK
jgi:hypothetical protein